MDENPLIIIDNEIFEIYSVRGDGKIYFQNTDNPEEQLSSHMEQALQNLKAGIWKPKLPDTPNDILLKVYQKQYDALLAKPNREKEEDKMMEAVNRKMNAIKLEIQPDVLKKNLEQRVNQPPETRQKTKFNFDPTAHYDGETIAKQLVRETFQKLKQVTPSKKLNINPKTLSLMNESNQTGNPNEIKQGDLVSVPFNNSFLKGVVETITETELTINNYKQGKVRISKNADIQKFFKGQKYDTRELIPVVDRFLKKTEIGSYYGLDRKDQARLLAGYTTNEVIKGTSLIEDKDGVKNPKDWETKIQVYKKSDGSLAINTQFKQEKLSPNVYGKEVTEEQMNVLKEGKKLVLERSTKEGKAFKIIASFDKDLNAIVTQPYSEKQEVKIKEALEMQNKLSPNVYGKEVTEEQMSALKEGKKLVLERNTKEGEAFKVIASFNKDLNVIVTQPYNEKKEALEKSKSQKQSPDTQPEQKKTLEQAAPKASKTTKRKPSL